MTIPKTLRPLAIRDYRLLFMGAVVSNAGSFMQNVAVQWLVYQQTRSVAWVGLVAFAQFVPLLFASPLSGVLADRHDRRVILLVAQTAQMAASATLAALTMLGLARPGIVLGIVLVLGAGAALHGPAWQATVPHLVPRALLTRAIALNSAQLSLGRVAGPALGGALLATVGPGAVFLVNAASYLAVIAAVWRLRLPALPEQERTPVLAHLRAGVSYAAADPMLRWLLVAVGCISLLAAPLVTLLPVYADEVLGGGPAALGVLTAALGVGSLVGSMLLGQAGDRLRPPALVGGGMGLLGAAMVLIAVGGPTRLVIAGVALTGLLRFGTVAASNSEIQQRVDERYRGRVMSLFLLTFGGAYPVGSLLVGVAAQRWGVAGVTATMGVAMVVAGATVGRALRQTARATAPASGASLTAAA